MWAQVVVFLALFDATEWLTIGLMVFAGVQVYVPHRAEQQRLRERALDELEKQGQRDRDEDMSFQITWSEHLRLDALADDWDKEDLLRLSTLGVLDPEHVLPRDWSVIMTALARLSREAGVLGAVALSLGHDTARNIASLNGLVEGFRVQYPNRGPEEIQSLVRSNRGGQVDALQKDIKRDTRNLALLLWDAVRHSPRADIARVLDFHDDMTSEIGKAAVAALKEREQTGLAQETTVEKNRK